ncbi:MAG TPA: hypothetical protein PKM51_00490 [Chitinophagales bacterium]|nr:hypothetical protein [Chitinophagales bacterium]
MKNFKLFFILIIYCISFSACQKENNEHEGWQFTKLVNTSLDADGNMTTLDFYQKKGNEWRVVRMEPDDYTSFNLKEIITPKDYQLPVTDNVNIFMTCNAKLFNPSTNLIHTQNKMKWLLNDIPSFNSTFSFASGFPDISTSFNAINKFSAATYSLEKAYNNDAQTDTYIFYDFPNQKYLYYGKRSTTPLIIQSNLPDMCSTCNQINWKTIDAVTSTNQKDFSYYYFFDFDAKKLHILERNDKNTDHPSFSFDKGFTLDFSYSFHKEYTSPDKDKPFDFSK